MAKSDFCFTYYDGDATRDMSHMNRLERGAYTDLIIIQRKFGHLTLDRIKKTLGKDFVECWESISVVLKQDQEQLFYIEWLEISERKAKKHAEKQSENRKGKTNSEPNATKQQPNNNQTKPLEDGDENGDVFDNEINNESGRDFSKPDIQGDSIVFPIDTGTVRELWAKWKEYRWREHEQRYGMMGEQADLKRLEKMDFKQIESTILTAISNKWKNLYPESNGTRTNKNASGKVGGAKTDQSRATSDYLTDYYSHKAKQQ